MLTRRSFIRRGGLAMTAATAVPSFFARAAQAAMARENAAGQADDTILVVVQMSGGNDGLNTVVPYGMDGYRQARPNLGVKESDVLPLTDTIGLHPQMEKIRDLYQAGHVAIVQGAGYPSPNLSHFRAMEIWHTAAPENYDASGWLADYLATTTADDNNPMYAASVTNGLSRALYGIGSAVPTIGSIPAYQFRVDSRFPADRGNQLGYVNLAYRQDYSANPLEAHVARTGTNAIASSERVQQSVQGYGAAAEYPNFSLANSLKTVAQLMSGGLGTRVYYVAFGGFDTHSAEAGTHNRLMGGFSDSVGAFLEDVAAMGKSDRVLLMTFSEFGRRVQENGSQGTDHGTAGPMFIIGDRVRGGLFGEHPNMTVLDANRNLRYGVDFRSVYGTVLDGWLGADQKLVLGAKYENVGFF